MTKLFKSEKSQKKGILFACSLGSEKDVDRMLKLGCDPRETNNSGDEAIIIAAKHNSVGCVKKLLEVGVPSDVKSGSGKTIKYYAEHYKNNEMIKLIDCYESGQSNTNKP